MPHSQLWNSKSVGGDFNTTHRQRCDVTRMTAHILPEWTWPLICPWTSPLAIAGSKLPANHKRAKVFLVKLKVEITQKSFKEGNMRGKAKQTNWWKVIVIGLLCAVLLAGIGYGIYAIVDYVQNDNQVEEEVPDTETPTDEEQGETSDEETLANTAFVEYADYIAC